MLMFVSNIYNTSIIYAKIYYVQKQRSFLPLTYVSMFQLMKLLFESD